MAIDKTGKYYEIWDPAGNAIPNLRPPLRSESPDAPAAVVKRLVHLAKYHATQQLENHDPQSPLARKLIVELTGMQAEYNPGEPPDPKPFDEPGNTPIVHTGQWTFLRIHNRATQPINMAVLDLQPDWGITQIYPSGQGDWSVQIEPGHEEIIPLKADLPAGFNEGNDVLKIFATENVANFRRLELPTLDQPRLHSAEQCRSATPSRQNPLEELMDAIAGEQPLTLATRQMTTVAYPSREWTTASVEIHVRRNS